MLRYRAIIAASLLALSCSGCAAPMLATNHATPPSDPQPARANQSRDVPSSATPKRTAADDQKLQEIVAELQQLGINDPVAQDRLFEDLGQSDPSLWPLVMQQFRATVAYRRRAAARNPHLYAERLPPVDDATTLQSPLAQNSPSATANSDPVIQASYGAPMQSPYVPPIADDWRQRLGATIEKLEAETPPNPSSPAEIAQHARLRMLYAAAGRKEDAARPIPASVPAAQRFLSKQLDGLTTWLDVERTPDPTRRAAEIKPTFTESLSNLSELAPLTLRNLSFCTEVHSFGCLKRFDKNEFTPNQEVLLYAELENFGSQSTPKGYLTSLRSSYQLIDVRGERVEERNFPPTEEYCQNLRRDFFLGYRLRLPKKLPPGSYTLQLTIQDLKCQKSGQSSIQFTIKDGKPPTP